MKTLKELQSQLKLHPTEQCSSLKYAARMKIDWDVYLPTKKKNLQRELVWTLAQKRELINSVFLGRHIPHLAILHTKDEVWQIIDGKQRLFTLLSFLEDKFTVVLDGDLYLFSALPPDYQQGMRNLFLRYYIVNELEQPVTDEDKITWFRFLNYAGTPQEQKHLEGLI